MTNEEMLAELAEAAIACESARRAKAKADAYRDQLVRRLMHTGIPRGRIVEASGLKIARLYQIRDDHR